MSKKTDFLDIKFTPQQEEALYNIGKKALVEAAVFGEAKIKVPVFKPKIILKKGKR